MSDKQNKLIQIGENIRKVRVKKHLTQADVAEKSGISVNYYSRIERGEVNQSVETLEAILTTLKTKSSDILPF
ncbi:helix-turn-helix transcriptional regulator [Candidatus Saccharibacteria bacterium]|nr:helix-turn-helix transcriptional regulator [Candidatus Saccharibacteria bacterium]